VRSGRGQHPSSLGGDRCRPAAQAPSERHHQLKHTLATRAYRGRILEQWQYEVTGGGRILYLIDDATRTVWLTYAGTGHPKATD
jgi:hypothetical protein